MPLRLLLADEANLILPVLSVRRNKTKFDVAQFISQFIIVIIILCVIVV